MTEETKRKSETIERIATKLSILAILGGAIAAINHYAGYSFLKGVIEVIGLGNSNVELSNQETTHMTMFAIRTMHENWMDEVAKYEQRKKSGKLRQPSQRKSPRRHQSR